MNIIPFKILYCDKQNFPPGYHVDLEPNDSFQLHFIHRGKGYFKTAEKSFSISENQCYIVFPGDKVSIFTDDNISLSTSNLSFSSTEFEGILHSWDITKDSPIISFDDKCRVFYYIEEIIANNSYTPGSNWRILGNLFKIFGELERFVLEQQSAAMDDHIQKAIKFMESNYTRPISVSDIVKNVCLERSYFSHLFKVTTGVSPKDFLNKYRMGKAMELLLGTSYSIEVVADSVGYRDPLHFSRNFKVYSGFTPTSFRQKGINTNIHR